MPKHVAIAVVEHENCFLVGVREQGIALAGYAEFPGGKVEPHESPEEAAIRECREEAGLDVQIVKLLHDIEYDYPHGLLHIHFFLCAPVEHNLPHDVPLAGNFRWVPRRELTSLKFPPANDEMLKLLLNSTLPINAP